MECNGIRGWDNATFPDFAALAMGYCFWAVRWQLHPGYDAATVNLDSAIINPSGINQLHLDPIKRKCNSNNKVTAVPSTPSPLGRSDPPIIEGR